MFVTLDHPHYLWLLLLAVPIVWLGRLSLASADRWRRWSAIALRVIVLTLLVIALAGLQTVRQRNDMAVVAIVDQSDSVRRYVTPPNPPTSPSTPTESALTATPLDVDQWLDGWLRKSLDKRGPDDRMALVTFDGRPTVRAMPSPKVDLVGSVAPEPTDGTDIAAAIRSGMAVFPEGAGRRMVLVSDGNDTSQAGTTGAMMSDGDLLAAAREAKAAGVRIDVLPLVYSVNSEVLVDGVFAPADAQPGQTIAVRVVLSATQPTPGLLFLKHDGLLLDLSPGDAATAGAAVARGEWAAAAVSDDAGAGVTASLSRERRFLCVRRFEVPLVSKGPNRFESIFEPAKGFDAVASNNRGEAVTLVSGKGRILFVNQLNSESGAILPRTLTGRGIDLDIVSATQLPVDVRDLERYDAVYFQDVPADAVADRQQQVIAQFVNELGGGFVMVGGPDSFGAGGWKGTMIDRILPVSCAVPNERQMPAGALVIVMDRSGSMAEPVISAAGAFTKQQLANEAAVQAISTLQARDRVGVVAFDSEAQWVVDLGPNDDARESSRKVRAISPGGGTNIYPGLAMAYGALAKLKPEDVAIKHIILLTDGQSEQGGNYDKVVRDMRAANITLTTVGVGAQVNGPLLTQLAKAGGGAYHYVDDPTTLPQIFIKEAKTVRKPLLREQTFQPALVRTGSPVMQGITATPPLRGLVITSRKDDPRVFLPLVSDKDEPVFAHWQVGLGQVAAFTSDATNHWGVDWLPWPGYGDFWTRMTRTIARPAAGRGYDLVTRFDRDMLRVRLDASQANQVSGGDVSKDTFANFLDAAGTVILPDGSTQPVTLRQTGPGVYEGSLPARATGSYLVTLMTQNARGERRTVIGGATRPPGVELRRFASNRATLEEVAAITGGRVLEPVAADAELLFDKSGLTPTRSVRPVWWPVVAWLLGLFILDVAARRLAWDSDTIRKWLGSVFGAAQPRAADAAGTLGALRRRAGEVDEQTGKERQALPKRRAAREASPQVVYEDVSEEPYVAPDSQGLFEPKRKKEASEESQAREEGKSEVTNRLLDAKRRARKMRE